MERGILIGLAMAFALKTIFWIIDERKKYKRDLERQKKFK